MAKQGFKSNPKTVFPDVFPDPLSFFRKIPIFFPGPPPFFRKIPVFFPREGWKNLGISVAFFSKAAWQLPPSLEAIMLLRPQGAENYTKPPQATADPDMKKIEGEQNMDDDFSGVFPPAG